MKQTTNHRYGRLPINFGDENTRRAYELELEAASKAQTVPMAVAPRCQLVLPSGKVLHGGAPVTWADYASDPTELRKQLNCSRVIEWDSPPPEAA